MVSKAKSTRGSAQAIDYILSDKENGKALVLDKNGVIGENGKDILAEMRFVQSSNRNCINNTISMVISPNQENGISLTTKELREILHKQLSNMGLKDHQYISSIHTSTNTKHIHVIINRINNKGEALNDSFISKKAQESSEKIASEKGWKTAKDVQLEKKEIMKNIKTKINAIIKKDCPKDINSYFNSLRNAGLNVEVVKSNFFDKISGYKIEGFKASDISRDFSINKINAILNIAVKSFANTFQRH